MSTPPVPPPTPGTGPVVDRDTAPTQRPYREDPAIAHRERTTGRTTHTDGARQARVDAVARDLGATDLPSDREHEPSIARELVQTAEANLAAAVVADAPERAAAVEDIAKAPTDVQRARDRHEQAQLASRRARVAVPDEPLGGVRMTHRWVPLLIAPVLVYLELQLGATPIRAALGIGTLEAMAIAVAIAVALTLASEALGLVLGGALRHSRRATRAGLGVLLGLVVACAVWSVVALAIGRDDNLAYRDSLQTDSSGSSASGGFGSLVARDSGESGAPTRADGDAPDPLGADAEEGGGTDSSDGDGSSSEAEPNLNFMVPVTLLAMLAGALLAMRTALAREWHEARAARRSAETACDAARERLERTAAAEVDARRRLDLSDRALSAAAERELTTVATLLERFQTEYLRWCSRFERAPAPLRMPDLPPPHDLLERLVTPLRVLPMQPSVYTDPLPESGSGDSPFDAPDDEPAPAPVSSPGRPAGWSWDVSRPSIDEDDTVLPTTPNGDSTPAEET